MQPIEIIVIIFSVLVVSLVLGSYIYKKIKGIPTNTECANCHNKVNVNKMIKSIKRELDEERCQCNNCQN